MGSLLKGSLRYLNLFHSMISICLLVSGDLGLTILRKIHKSPYNLSAVFTNKNSDDIVNYCVNENISFFVGNPRNGKAASFIADIDCDILLSVNYLYIIENDIIQLPKLYAINIHGSLLPKYRGRTPHVWAIINGEKQTGITAHLIDEAVDNGAIIKQMVVPIEESDTGGIILAKFHALYPDFIDSILIEVVSNTLVFTKQNNDKATYFGKRTPTDGRINWDWNRERIRNWIRAQAKPYPGAFTFLEGNKLTIHQSDFHDYGFKQKDENGKILSVMSGKIIVKTTNGALLISHIESDFKLNFLTGSKFK